MAVSFIGRGNRIRRKPQKCHKSLTNFITQCCIEHTTIWVGFKLTTLMVIGTDCIGSWKCNYHMITTTTAPAPLWLTLTWPWPDHPNQCKTPNNLLKKYQPFTYEGAGFKLLMKGQVLNYLPIHFYIWRGRF